MTRWTGGEKKYTSRILVGEPEGRNFLEDLGVGWKIIFKLDVKDDRKGVNRTHLAQNVMHWRTRGHAVMKRPAAKKVGIFFCN